MLALEEPKKLKVTFYPQNGEDSYRTVSIEQSPEKTNYPIAPVTNKVAPNENAPDFNVKSYEGDVPLEDAYDAVCDLVQLSSNGVWSSRYVQSEFGFHSCVVVL